MLRKLVEAGTRIVQLGYGTDGGDVDEIVNNAQAEVYAVTERRRREDYLTSGCITAIGPTSMRIVILDKIGPGMEKQRCTLHVRGHSVHSGQAAPMRAIVDRIATSAPPKPGGLGKANPTITIASTLATCRRISISTRLRG